MFIFALAIKVEDREEKSRNLKEMEAKLVFPL